ncbi:MAG: hypothetical protein HY898_17415 [Deltaproteobacteria bacterium]|nr:hypothetical protein [Deltaproteobacteria bacterium]
MEPALPAVPAAPESLEFGGGLLEVLAVLQAESASKQANAPALIRK